MNSVQTLKVTVGEWNYIGVSVTMPAPLHQGRNDSTAGAVHFSNAGGNGTVQFFVNGAASNRLSLKRPAPDGQFGGDAVKLERFLGEMRAVGTFPNTALTLEQHNSFANKFSHSLMHASFAPASPVAPTPDLLMDPSDPVRCAFSDKNLHPRMPFLSGGHSSYRFTL
jgi:hypothetical protein